MAKKTYSGIYCIEGAWPERYEMSARPLLEMLADYHEIPTVHRMATSEEQFTARLREWASAEMTFAVLYLWYHGSPGGVAPDGYDSVNLEAIADVLGKRCANCLIHFGSCKTLKLKPKRVDSFLERTGAVAVSGYTKNVGIPRTLVGLSRSLWSYCIWTVCSARFLQREINVTSTRASCEQCRSE